MLNKITLDNKDFQFDESFLPCLVTGACKSGASYFSVSLVGNLIEQGSKVIFFTAFLMAKEELFKQIGANKTFEVTNEEEINDIPQDKSIIIQSGNKNLWEKVVKSINDIDNYVIFVKNIEEYDKSIIEVIWDNKKIFLSGSIDECKFKEDIAKKDWTSKIIFTKPEIDLQIEMPNLEKYESYLCSDNFGGILRLEK